MFLLHHRGIFIYLFSKFHEQISLSSKISQFFLLFIVFPSNFLPVEILIFETLTFEFSSSTQMLLSCFFSFIAKTSVTTRFASKIVFFMNFPYYFDPSVIFFLLRRSYFSAIIHLDFLRAIFVTNFCYHLTCESRIICIILKQISITILFVYRWQYAMHMSQSYASHNSCS